VVSSRFTFRFIAAHKDDGTWTMHVVEQRHVDLEPQIGTGNTVQSKSGLLHQSVQVQVRDRANGDENVASVDIHALSDQNGHSRCLRPRRANGKPTGYLRCPTEGERILRLSLHDSVDAGMADLQLGGNRPGGHPTSSHLKTFAAINDKALPAKVIGAALTLQSRIGGGSSFAAPDGLLLRQHRQQRNDDLTEHPGAINVLFGEALPLDAVVGQLAKVLKSVGSAFSRKPVQSPKQAEIIPLFVSVLEQPLKGFPVGKCARSSGQRIHRR
jgi:hypothetical protein